MRRRKAEDEEEIAADMGMPHATAAAASALYQETRAWERVWRAARRTRELSSGGRSARVCEAGVKAWMMGPGEQEEDLEATNEPIRVASGGRKGRARARARARRTKATKRAQG